MLWGLFIHFIPFSYRTRVHAKHLRGGVFTPHRNRAPLPWMCHFLILSNSHPNPQLSEGWGWERRAQGGTGGPLKTHQAPRSFVLRAGSAIQPCPTLCDPMHCSLPGPSVHGVLQARILEWVTIPFSRGSSHPGTEPRSRALQADSLPSELPGRNRTLPCSLHEAFPDAGNPNDFLLTLALGICLSL